MNIAREVTTTWQALKTIHPFFFNAESVPNEGDIDRGFYEPLGAHDRDRLEIDINLIEKYLTSNNTSLEIINIEDFIEDGTYLLNLDNSLQKLLHEFEDLIESDILQETLPVSSTKPPSSISWRDSRTILTSFLAYSRAKVFGSFPQIGRNMENYPNAPRVIIV